MELDPEILNENGPEPCEEGTSRDLGWSRELPAHLARLCEAEPLTAEQERAWFRRMNFLKYRANALRSTIDPEQPDPRVLDRVEQYAQQAQALRDKIVRANMRLVFSIAKKMVTGDHPFDELLSDGIVILMKAVEKFDYDRGFRFSTYAYRSIVRNASRSFQNVQKRRRRQTNLGGDLLQTVAAEAPGGLEERNWQALQAGVAQLMKQLDRREQFIVGARFSLGIHRRKHALQELAKRLGISKERVRQLERRALDKLHKLAVELRLDELLEPTLA